MEGEKKSICKTSSKNTLRICTVGGFIAIPLSAVTTYYAYKVLTNAKQNFRDKQVFSVITVKSLEDYARILFSIGVTAGSTTFGVMQAKETIKLFKSSGVSIYGEKINESCCLRARLGLTLFANSILTCTFLGISLASLCITCWVVGEKRDSFKDSSERI